MPGSCRSEKFTRKIPEKFTPRKIPPTREIYAQKNSANQVWVGGSHIPRERERERELGTGILFEEPNPTGSRPRDLIGLYGEEKERDPNRRKGAAGKRGGATGAPLRRGQP